MIRHGFTWCCAVLITTATAEVQADVADPVLVKADAKAWLRQVGAEEEAMRSFEKIWASDRPLLDRLTQVFELGDRDAAKSMARVRDETVAAPAEIPAALTDRTKSSLYRDNLGLAYAKVLVSRGAHEDALEALKLVNPDRCVDQAGYHFHKAAAQHALMKPKDATASIECGLFKTGNAPERYRRVAHLMLIDMEEWKGREFGLVGRSMRNVERRLRLGRGGPATQLLQVAVVERLDAMIKALEEEPPAKELKPKSEKVPEEADRSVRMPNWGKLPPKERAEAIADTIKQLPPSMRATAQEYLQRLSREQ